MRDIEMPGEIEDGSAIETNPEADAGRGFSISDLIRALRQSKGLILACVLIGLIGASVDVWRTKPIYESTATIRIDPSLVGSLGLEDLLGGGSNDEQQTEMAILKSYGVGVAALGNLKPDDFKRFTGMEQSAVDFNSMNRDMIDRQQLALGILEQSLRVKQVEGTQLLQLSLRSGSPELSATVLNRVVDTYLRHNFESRYDSVDQVRTWLNGQMDDLRKKAETAQTQLADFEERNNFLGTSASDNTIVENLKMLSEQLGVVESERIVKEGAMRAADAGDPAILASLVPNAKIAALQAQEASLYAQDVQLSSKFDSSYPPLIEVRQQESATKAEISKNLKLVSGRLHEEYDAAKMAESLLHDKYQRAIDEAFLLNRKQTEYAVLYGEVTTNRSLFNTLQKSLEQATVDAGLNSVNTMVVDRARPTLTPVEPKKTLLLSVGLLMGLVVGVGSALLREALTDVVRSIRDVEERVGLVTLTTVPHIDFGASSRGQTTAVPGSRLISVTEPRSRAAEAYRTLRNALLLSSIDRPHRKVVVTSALPGEGKSSTSVNYAIVLAQKGSRTLLIDGDLRRPVLHTIFRVPNTNGLSERILEDLESVDFTVPIPELPELYFLPAGKSVPFPSEALGSSRFRALLEQWSLNFDNIIIDSAPILAISDTLPIASWADSVVLVARADKTPVRALQRARATLRRARANVSGVVLNDASQSSEGYGYYYGKGYNDYYQ